MKCTKVQNARAQLLLCSLNLLFGDIAYLSSLIYVMAEDNAHALIDYSY